MTAVDKSFFVVVEGMDGSGKTGITRQLHAILGQIHAEDVALSFEPHDPSAAGLYVRNALTKRIKLSSVELALGFALNRADHNNFLNSFLDANRPRIIICDRYYVSSLVYQSTENLTMVDVYNLNQWARRPDLTIFLNVSPHKCYERMRNRPQDKELFEKNLGQRLLKYQDAISLLRAKGDLIVEVDANPDFPQVLNNVIDTLKAHAPDWVKIERPLFPYPLDETVDLSDLDMGQSHALLKSLLPDSVPVNPSDLKSQIEKAVQALSDAQAGLLFYEYITRHHFKWGQKLTWTDSNAYDLSYHLPMGFEQSGVALILDSSQQSDLITKTIHTILDKDADLAEMGRLSDFMIVLDNKRFEPKNRYEREGSSKGSSGRRISPHISIVTRADLADMLFLIALHQHYSLEEIAQLKDLPSGLSEMRVGLDESNPKG